MSDQTLYVVAAFFNYQQDPLLVSNALRFKAYMNSVEGVVLRLIECVKPGDPYQVTEPNTLDIQVTGNSVMWLKENLINIAASNLPMAWNYIAWVDVDVEFLSATWVQDTIEALDTYNIVQPWTTCNMLDPNDKTVQVYTSFGANPGSGHCGFAWATTSAVWNNLGGLPDFAVDGSGDVEFVRALTHSSSRMIHPRPIRSQDFIRKTMAYWQFRRPYRFTIGAVAGIINHYYHGNPGLRTHQGRADLMSDYVCSEIKANTQGVLEFTSPGSTLEQAITRYLESTKND